MDKQKLLQLCYSMLELIQIDKKKTVERCWVRLQSMVIRMLLNLCYLMAKSIQTEQNNEMKNAAELRYRIWLY